MKKTFVLFVAFVFVLLSLTACSGIFSSNATATPDAINTATPTPTAVTCVDNTPQATPTDMSTPTNTATATPTMSACFAAFNASAMSQFNVNKNMDVGDASLWSIVYAHNELNQYFVAVIEPKYNLDFESTMITGSFAQANADKATALCAAHEMLVGSTEPTYMLYVGASSAPDGWGISFPVGWKMSTTMYIDEPIVVTNSDWKNPVSVAISDTNHLYGDPVLWTYGQLWDGSNSKLVYHFIVETGYVVTTANLQGTVWPVGVDTANIDQLLARFAQMSAEVDQRDDHPVIIKIYVGGNNPPTGWSKDLPTGWTATKR